MSRRQRQHKIYEWWFTELSGRYVIPIVTTVMGFLIGWHTAPEEEWHWRWTVVVSVLCLMIGWFTDDVLRWHLRESQIGHDLAWIKGHLEGLSVTHNLHTDNNLMEELLRNSEGIKGKARWLIPLFLSKKFSEDLKQKDMVHFTLGDHEYSQFLEQLIPYCSKSIKMTCPHAPVEWLTRLLPKDKLQHALHGNMRLEHYPQHIQTLLTLSVDIKQRLVIITEDNLASFLENVAPLDAFIKSCNSSYKVLTRFAYQPTLCDGCDDNKEGRDCKLWKRDFQIWDDMISVEYEREKKHVVELRLRPDELSQMFTRCWSRADSHNAYSVKDMEGFIKKFKKTKQAQPLERWGESILLGRQSTTPVPGKKQT